MSNIGLKIWDSGVGIVLESAGNLKRAVYKPKTYKTLRNAVLYGRGKDPAPIEMLDGSERWTPLPFWRHDGRIYDYFETNTDPRV